MVAVLVIVGVLLAMVRIFGPSGVWGDSNTTYFDALGRIPAISVLTVCLAAFAWLALLLMAKQPASVRFQPPILVVIAGLFVVVVRAQLGDVPSVLLDSIVQLNDPFAYLLFWSAVAAACTLLPLPENRIVRRRRGCRRGRRRRGQPPDPVHRRALPGGCRRLRAVAARDRGVHAAGPGAHLLVRAGGARAGREHGENPHVPHLREAGRERPPGDDGPPVRRDEGRHRRLGRASAPLAEDFPFVNEP